MNRTSVLLLLLALFVGAAIGFVIREQLAGGNSTSPVLDKFSFADFSAQLNPSDWEVVVERSYDAYPPLSRNPRTARRIVAQASLPEAEQRTFATQFQSAVEAWITSHGATIKGKQNAESASTIAVEAGQQRSLVDLPRRFYAYDGINGVADFGCVASAGKVVVIISIVEGR